MTGNSKRSTTPHRSIRRHFLAATAVTLILGGSLGVLAANTELSGAVIAPGTLAVESSVKKVQHQAGGTVGEILVRDGRRVDAGDILLRLDGTVARSNLATVTKSLDEFAARKARLEAERDDGDDIVFPASLRARADDIDLAALIEGERKLFELRRSALLGQKAQLNERVAQLREEIRGLDEQADAKQQEIVLIKRELSAVRDLWDKNLVQINRLTALERDSVRLVGDRGHLIASVAQTRGKITETELQIIQVDQNFRSDVGKDLAEIRAKTSELVEKKVTAEDALKHIDIRSPQSGMVHQLAVHTVGGVINPGDVIMQIVPVADVLIVEAKVAPSDIDQLQPGQVAIVRFSSFSQRTTPEIDGEVFRIAADTTADQRTGATHYTVGIAISAVELSRLGNVKLVPGMPVEVFMRTGDRTMFSYLTKPFVDQAKRAFREK